jgi:hypothetical protein
MRALLSSGSSSFAFKSAVNYKNSLAGRQAGKASWSWRDHLPSPTTYHKKNQSCSQNLAEEDRPFIHGLCNFVRI